jgi:PAS domain S-box-containing protein
VNSKYFFLKNGGQMGALFRAKDWTGTPLGSIEFWPESLRSAISISLNSGFPIAIFWGESLNLLYNDAYMPILGSKHPSALGLPGQEVWPEIWHTLAAEFEAVMQSGLSIRNPDTMLLINRYGYKEECYFDYTLSPIMDTAGTVVGVFNAVIETSHKVISNRRNQILQRFLQRQNSATTTAEALKNIEEIFSFAKPDILYYELEINDYSSITPNKETEVRLPLSKEDTPVNGFIILGLSELKKLDEDYRQFLESIAGYVGTLLNNAYAKAQHMELVSLNLKLTESNEELAAAYEELDAINEELQQSTVLLYEGNARLKESEEQLQLAITTANIGTWYIDATTREFIPSARLKEMFGYLPQETLTYQAAINQIQEEHQQRVIEAVEAAITKNAPYDLEYPIIGHHDRNLRWIKATGKLHINENGSPGNFYGTMADISMQKEHEEQLQSFNEEMAVLNEELRASNQEQAIINEELIKLNRQISLSQDELQLAITAAGMGTWDLNPATGKFTGSDLTKSWFGLKPEDEIDLSKATDMIVQDDRNRVIKEIKQALNHSSGGDYDTYYTITSPLNPVPRIVRAKGKALFNEQNQPIRFSGVLQDVTEIKKDEQRKNDFIAMVSHELKTPLTSMNGYLQVLQGKTKGYRDDFITSL